MSTLGDAEAAIVAREEELKAVKNDRAREIHEAQRIKDKEIYLLKKRVEDLEKLIAEQKRILASTGQTRQEEEARLSRQQQLASLAEALKRYVNINNNDLKMNSNSLVFRSTGQSNPSSATSYASVAAAAPSQVEPMQVVPSQAAPSQAAPSQAAPAQAAPGLPAPAPSPYRIPRREPSTMQSNSNPSPSPSNAWSGAPSPQGWNAQAAYAAPAAPAADAQGPPAVMAAYGQPAAAAYRQPAAAYMQPAAAYGQQAAVAPQGVPPQQNPARGLRICTRRDCPRVGCAFVHPTLGNIYNYLPPDLSNSDIFIRRNGESPRGASQHGTGQQRPGRPGRTRQRKAPGRASSSPWRRSL